MGDEGPSCLWSYLPTVLCLVAAVRMMDAFPPARVHKREIFASDPPRTLSPPAPGGLSAAG